MTKPGVSCICLTYGRSWLLAEAIESFIRQDFDLPAELIIVNDFEGITLTIDQEAYGERIRIVNLPKRMGSLNDKFDLGVKMARFPLICMWDDDDISLPHRLDQGACAWHWLHQPDYVGFTHHYNLDAGKAPTLVNRGIHGGDIFTRAAYMAMGGSKGEGHNDENFVAKVKADANYKTWDNSRDVAYIYRWAGITAHHSCYARDVKTCMARFHADVVADKRFRAGRLQIVPAWGQDYVELTDAR